MQSTPQRSLIRRTGELAAAFLATAAVILAAYLLPATADWRVPALGWQVLRSDSTVGGALCADASAAAAPTCWT